MRIVSLLIGIFIVIMTVGCSTVVYRVNPDLPPRMGIEEAKEALELSLSLAQKPIEIKSFTIQGDEFVLVRHIFGPSSNEMTVIGFPVRLSYDNISSIVEKHGKDFAVRVSWRGRYSASYHFLWKSEQDARIFVDASYALRPASLQRDKSKTEIAALPAHPVQKDVPREAPEPIKPARQLKSTEPAIEKAKPPPPLPSETAPAETPPLLLVEKTPPKITITSPDVTASLKVAAKESRITVAGVAESKIGISEITVNGLLAKVQNKGNFSTDVFLKAGPNVIVITAFDTQRIKTSKQLIVHREDIEPALVKKEAPVVVAVKKPIQAPTIPEAKKVPKEEPRLVVTAPIQPSPAKVVIPPVKIEKQDIAKKDPPVVAPAKEPEKSHPSPVEEKILPKILIVSPDIASKKPVISKEYSMTIAGRVESKAGLAAVLINGYPVNVDDKGNFSGDVFLKIGKNNIIVTAIDLNKNQATRDFVVDRERVQVIKALQVDVAIPKIVIVSPDVTRAVSVVPKKSNITIIGLAESKVGIADVIINGQPANMDEKGNFSADVPVKVGKNDVTVTAIDLYGKQATKQFVVNREADKVALVKKEEPEPETRFMTGKYHALLIAVQDYSNPEIGKLDYPVSDAQRLMNVLNSGYHFDKENMTLLHNPDRRTIYKTLQSMRKQLKAEDSLLIFYAGHGMWIDDMKQGFWLPSDAAGLNDPSDWIPNSNIRDYIKAIKAKHILLVADACFSGGIFKLRDAPISPSTSVEKIYEMPSRKAMTSGSLKTVPDQSVFVEFLIKRLDENKDPYLDAQKLFARMREAVIHNSKTNQTPLYGAINEAGDEGGDFIFVRKQ